MNGRMAVAKQGCLGFDANAGGPVSLLLLRSVLRGRNSADHAYPTFSHRWRDDMDC